MVKETVVYKQGSLCVCAFLDRGFTSYSNTPAIQCVLKNPGSKVMYYEDAAKQIEAIAKEKFNTPWKKITAERFEEMLNCLPPQAWVINDTWQAFRLSEYTYSYYTMHFVKLGGNYFEATKPNTCKYVDLINEINSQFNNN